MPVIEKLSLMSIILLLIIGYLIDGYSSSNTSSDNAGVISSLVRVYTDQLREFPLNATTGQTVAITGTAQSLVVNSNLQIFISMKSNMTEGTNWILLATEPRGNFTITPEHIIRYEFDVKFLKHGTYLMQPYAQITKIGNDVPTNSSRIAAACPACVSDGLVYIVAGQNIANSNNLPIHPPITILLLAIVIGVSGLVAVVIVYRKRRIKT
jgi:hypothetical protein